MTRSANDMLPAMLQAMARAHPDAPALAWRNSGWTYAELAAASIAVAGCLRGKGLAAGDRVGLLFRNSPQYVAAYYGALASGCVAVPLNPHERAQVLARQLAHCHARMLLGDAGHPEWGEVSVSASADGIAGTGFHVEDDPDALNRFLCDLGDPADGSEFTPAPEMLAAIIYTSGTTGSPKGVKLSHGNLAANTHAIVSYLDLQSDDRGMAVLPFQFSYGSSVLHMHLAVGAELLIEDSMAYPHAVLQRMVEEEVTGFSGVPSTFALLLTRCELKDFDLSRLRYLTQAGGPMPRSFVDRLRNELPGTRIFIMYGQTEATARLSYLPPERLDEKPGSVGFAIPGVELAVVRPDETRADPGEIGEIIARGPNVMQGYFNDETATLATLRGGWLHTGDLGHMDDDGCLYIDGRAVEMIKVGAFRVSPQEVEEVIAGIPGVAEVGVTAVPDTLLGQAIKAVVVLREGELMDSRAVQAHCRKQLAMYKVPKLVEFAKALPYTTTGKVQRRQLA